ncbi:LytTR family DNA-binding domain-containing protein [Pseudoalteromonas sp. OOF1S-7]|uniref:LytTR family DNA-binding domain-containing protein n=1 Tax=Pseudoalteromonas sp. OOF1S-7 TaxID=2917757 RepID=UPI001EF46444|nr:LytTR family DNA-binding domain-containing protein [Pseudoalteromonas sp. OOF1S-7]MCG7536118.1 LytTR family transcriptional regulator [Pseudoalteromonas sp. OOF1S-7]
MVSARIRQEWLLSLCGWTLVIGFLTFIDLLHDWSVPEDKRLNNPLWWAVQEWGLWYLISPVIFRALARLEPAPRVDTTAFLKIMTAAYFIAMLFQALFDLIALDDPIAYTLYYFAPSHLLVLFVITILWHTQLRTIADPRQHQQALWVDQGRDKVLVAFDDITHISAASNYMEIHTLTQQYLKRGTLKELMAKLPAQFVRTHRSHVVNLSAIERIQNKPSGSAMIQLRSGTQVALSKGYKQAVKARFTQNA